MLTTNDRPWRQPKIIALAAVVLVGTACQSPLSPLPSPRPLGSELEAFSPRRVDQRPARTLFREPLGELTLVSALGAALENSPRLEAFSWKVRADEARALQAGLFPNPTLQVEGENFAGQGDFSGYGNAETTVFLGQLVELGAKRAKRRRVAMLDRELSGWDYEAARLDVLTETSKRFINALAAEERLALATDILAVSEAALDATRARVRAGAASSIEESRSAVVVATIGVELSRRRVELDASLRALASSWDGTPQFSSLSGSLRELGDLPSLEDISSSLAANPDVARWASEVSRREAAIELARARGIPDVTAGLGVRHLGESDDAALVFGIQMPLPVFDRNQGARAAAHAEASRARAHSRQARLALTRSLIASHAQALAAFGNAQTLGSHVLPQAESAYEQTREAYRKGLFKLVDVLDAQRTLYSARTEYVNALALYHSARAEIERLVGTPLENLANRSN